MIDAELAVNDLMAHIFGLFLLGVTLGTQEVGEEYQPDDHKENKQLDADNQPQGLAHSHAAEPIIVEIEDPGPEPLPGLLIVAHG